MEKYEPACEVCKLCCLNKILQYVARTRRYRSTHPNFLFRIFDTIKRTERENADQGCQMSSLQSPSTFCMG
jgi:hypothetical protein